MQACLPLGYYGEAVLHVAYLWNLLLTRVLPGNKTPFEALHGWKPDLSHLRIFGARCFARVPTELHVKNGPHSCEAIFTGYPDGVKGWRLRDTKSGAFFNAWDVIFDEDSVSRSRDSSESLCTALVVPPFSKDESSVLPPGSGGASSSPSSVELSPIVIPPNHTAPAPIVDADVVLPPPCHSAHIPVLTEKGAEYAAEIQCQRERLNATHMAWAGIEITEAPPSEGAALAVITAAADTLHGDKNHVDTFPVAQVNFIITKQANLSVRSDCRCKPTDLGYNMSVPPATYDEAMRCADCDGWLQAMHTELGLMKEMKVWELVEPPPGWKRIRNRWVFEFKMNDQKGGS